MKKIGISLFIIFIFFAALYAVSQSNIGRNLAKSLLENALENSGLTVKIGKVEGTIPHQLKLKEVSIQGDGVNVRIEELSLRLILWRLVKKEVAFNSVQAHNIIWKEGSPFDFAGRFRVNQKKAYLNGKLADWRIDIRLDRPEKTATFIASGDLLHAKGKAYLDANYQLNTANVQIGSDRLFAKLPFTATGRLVGSAQIQRNQGVYEARANWQIPTLRIENTRIRSVKGEGKATLQNHLLKGELALSGQLSGDLWKTNADFSWVEGDSFFFPHITLTSPHAKGSGDLEVRPDWRLIGKNQLELDNLHLLGLPDVYGKTQAKAEWHLIKDIQGLKLDASITDFYYGTASAQKVSFYSDLSDPFGKISGLIDLQAEKGKWDGLEVELASLQTSSRDESWPFHLSAEGKWRHPLDVKMDGTWKSPFIVDVQTLTGTFFNHPFTLEKPISLEKTDTLFRLSDVEIVVAGAAVSFELDRNKDNTHAHLRFKELPIDFLSLNPLDVPIAGTLNLEAEIREEKNRLKGDFKASIDNLEVAEKSRAAGKFEGHFNRDLLSLKGNLTVKNKPLLNLDLSLPIHFSLWPFQSELFLHKPVTGKLALNGRIEDFVDFLNLGPHRLEGDCTSELQLTNTLYHPHLKGSCHFQNGYYQNYYTGTELYDINAEFLAKKDKVFLTSFTAKDYSRAGSLSGTGEIALHHGELYPFKGDLLISNFQFVEIDLVTSAAQGKIHIEGNTSSALAKGDIHLIETELHIPDHIPRPLPNLQVTYKNATHPILPTQPAPYKPYPLFLDLHVKAPEKVTIDGRGLNSEWNGDFHLGGTYTDLAAQGKLELVSGEFNFSSRSFKLTEGSVSLSGKEHEMPYINLAGSMETKGISIIARLKGPLNNPQITLQSTPPLPLGSILSHLLFGQDLSEISGFQAFQLASSLAGLAGTGPDIMESTRRSLGIDRLRVITDPTEEGGETIALQVGKYVSKGVLVSFTQGTEDRGTNISIEVEIKDNLVFVLESDQQPDPQGKFSLKWNLNY